MLASKDSNSFVIEITDDSEVVEIDGVGSLEELRETVQGTARRSQVMHLFKRISKDILPQQDETARATKYDSHRRK